MLKNQQFAAFSINSLQKDLPKLNAFRNLKQNSNVATQRLEESLIQQQRQEQISLQQQSIKNREQIKESIINTQKQAFQFQNTTVSLKPDSIISKGLLNAVRLQITDKFIQNQEVEAILKQQEKAEEKLVMSAAANFGYKTQYGSNFGRQRKHQRNRSSYNFNDSKNDIHPWSAEPNSRNQLHNILRDSYSQMHNKIGDQQQQQTDQESQECRQPSQKTEKEQKFATNYLRLKSQKSQRSNATSNVQKSVRRNQNILYQNGIAHYIATHTQIKPQTFDHSFTVVNNSQLHSSQLNNHHDEANKRVSPLNVEQGLVNNYINPMNFTDSLLGSKSSDRKQVLKQNTQFQDRRIQQDKNNQQESSQAKSKALNARNERNAMDLKFKKAQIGYKFYTTLRTSGNLANKNQSPSKTNQDIEHLVNHHTLFYNDRDNGNHQLNELKGLISQNDISLDDKIVNSLQLYQPTQSSDDNPLSTRFKGKDLAPNKQQHLLEKKEERLQEGRTLNRVMLNDLSVESQKKHYASQDGSLYSLDESTKKLPNGNDQGILIKISQGKYNLEHQNLQRPNKFFKTSDADTGKTALHSSVAWSRNMTFTSAQNGNALMNTDYVIRRGISTSYHSNQHNKTSKQIRSHNLNLSLYTQKIPLLPHEQQFQPEIYFARQKFMEEKERALTMEQKRREINALSQDLIANIITEHQQDKEEESFPDVARRIFSQGGRHACSRFVEKATKYNENLISLNKQRENQGANKKSKSRQNKRNPAAEQPVEGESKQIERQVTTFEQGRDSMLSKFSADPLPDFINSASVGIQNNDLQSQRDIQNSQQNFEMSNTSIRQNSKSPTQKSATRPNQFDYSSSKTVNNIKTLFKANILRSNQQRRNHKGLVSNAIRVPSIQYHAEEIQRFSHTQVIKKGASPTKAEYRKKHNQNINKQVFKSPTLQKPLVTELSNEDPSSQGSNQVNQTVTEFKATQLSTQPSVAQTYLHSQVIYSDPLNRKINSNQYETRIGSNMSIAKLVQARDSLRQSIQNKFYLNLLAKGAGDTANQNQATDIDLLDKQQNSQLSQGTQLKSDLMSVTLERDEQILHQSHSQDEQEAVVQDQVQPNLQAEPSIMLNRDPLFNSGVMKQSINSQNFRAQVVYHLTPGANPPQDKQAVKPEEELKQTHFNMSMLPHLHRKHHVSLQQKVWKEALKARQRDERRTRQLNQEHERKRLLSFKQQVHESRELQQEQQLSMLNKFESLNQQMKNQNQQFRGLRGVANLNKTQDYSAMIDNPDLLYAGRSNNKYFQALNNEQERNRGRLEGKEPNKLMEQTRKEMKYANKTDQEKLQLQIHKSGCPFVVTKNAFDQQSQSQVDQLFGELSSSDQYIVPLLKQNCLLEYVKDSFKSEMGSESKLRDFNYFCQFTNESYSLVLYGHDTPLSNCCKQLICFQFCLDSTKKAQIQVKPAELGWLKVICLDPLCQLNPLSKKRLMPQFLEIIFKTPNIKTQRDSQNVQQGLIENSQSNQIKLQDQRNVGRPGKYVEIDVRVNTVQSNQRDYLDSSAPTLLSEGRSSTTHQGHLSSTKNQFAQRTQVFEQKPIYDDDSKQTLERLQRHNELSGSLERIVNQVNQDQLLNDETPKVTQGRIGQSDTVSMVVDIRNLQSSQRSQAESKFRQRKNPHSRQRGSRDMEQGDTGKSGEELSCWPKRDSIPSIEGTVAIGNGNTKSLDIGLCVGKSVDLGDSALLLKQDFEIGEGEMLQSRAEQEEMQKTSQPKEIERDVAAIELQGLDNQSVSDIHDASFRMQQKE